MNSSEEQFQELVANLVARANKALSESDQITCMGLLLSPVGDVEVVLAVSENDDLGEEVELLQNALIKKSKETSAVAACLSYPDYQNSEIVAYLENDANYCTKLRIPVAGSPTLTLDLEKIEVEDGAVFVFGASDT